MTTSRRLTRVLAVAGITLMFAPSMVGVAQFATANNALVDGTRLRMNPEEGLPAREPIAVIGDPAKPGIYIYRNRFGPGNMSRPHFHDQDRYVTVIKGTWWTGEGDFVQPDKMIPIRAGGLMFHPAGLHHYDGAREDEVIVQIMGMGPVKTTQTEVDAQGKPVRR